MNKSSNLTEAFLAGMLNDSCIDRLMAIDNDWRIIAWNRTSEDHSGFKKSSLLGKDLFDVFPQYKQDEEVLAAIKNAFTGVKTFVPAQKEFPYRAHFENHFIPLKDEDGSILGVMNTMHDVSHRIKAEDQLQHLHSALKKKYEQLERTAGELATITYITSHNIKEPLRQVYSGIELLVRSEAKTLSDGSKANLRRMQSSLNRMNLLLDDVLALSGVSTIIEEEQPVDLNEVLQSATQQMDEKIKVNDVHIEAEALPIVWGHKDMLYHLFQHLIQNAIRFRQNNKPVQLTVSSQPTALAEGSYIHISVADNGIGFDPEEAAKLFTMTDKLANTPVTPGAGLAICRKIMLAHGGFIEAESKSGEGAVYHCYFPAAGDQ